MIMKIYTIIIYPSAKINHLNILTRVEYLLRIFNVE